MSGKGEVCADEEPKDVYVGRWGGAGQGNENCCCFQINCTPQIHPDLMPLKI
jgi:hypothetical protein